MKKQLLGSQNQNQNQNPEPDFACFKLIDRRTS